MTAVDAFLQPRPAPGDELIKRGRYQIVPADGGNPKPHTRITNFAKKLEDTYNLQKWGERMVLLGTAARSDIVAGALANSDDKDELEKLVEAAKDAAQANVRRETGTHLHRMTERVDAGETLELPEPYASDIRAYTSALASIGAEVEMIEAVVVHEGLNLAGRLDRTVFVHAFGGKRFIADLKTGEDLSYSWGSIAVQLALYADASTIYDPATKKHRPMVEVDQSRALVIHLPAGKGEATLYWVNLEAGRHAIDLTSKVMAWRRESRKVATTEPLQFTARAELREYVERRVRYVIECGHGGELAKHWPKKLPTLKNSDAHTEGQLDLILACCDIVEAAQLIPFPNLTDPRS